MTSKEFLEAEAHNDKNIILYREGLFWKAYERSAYAVCTQVKPLKAIKKRLKSLDGEEIVSIGFPTEHEQKYIGALETVERSEKRLVLYSPAPIDEQAFDTWKQELGLQPPAIRPKETDNRDALWKNGSYGSLAEKRRSFDLAASTPLDCMLFINELKQLL